MTDSPVETTEPQPPLDFQKVAPLALALLVVIAFIPLVRHDFLAWDDHLTIALNPDLNPVTLSGMARYWDPTRPHMDLYAPLTYTMWGVVALAARVEQPDPAGITLNPMIFHLVNILLHVGSAVIVLQILRLLLPRALWAAVVGAALWAVHPVQVETVGWISGGKDLLSGLLGLGALWLYLSFAKAIRDGERDAQPVMAYLLATALLVLALLAKPSAVAVPLIALALDWLVVRRPLAVVVKPLAVWVVVCIPFIVMGYVHQENARFVESPLWARPLVALDALAFYLIKLVAPVQLAPDYGRTPTWLLQSTAVYWTWLVPVAVGAVCWILRRRVPELGAGFVVFIAALLPVLGLLRFDYQIYSTVADHYLYLAMLGPAVVVASLLARRPLPDDDQLVPLTALDRWVQVGLVVIAILGIRSFVQTFVWHDTPTLFQHNVAVNPRSLAGNTILGTWYAEQAGLARAEAQQAMSERDLALALALQQAAQDYDQRALEHYRVSLAVRPNDPIIRFNLGNRLLASDPAEAIEHYRVAIELEPEAPRFHNNLGIALLETQQYTEAAEAFGSAIALSPDWPLAYANLGIALTHLGQTEEAIEQYEAALKLDPNFELARRNLERLEQMEQVPPQPDEATPDTVPPAEPAVDR